MNIPAPSASPTGRTPPETAASGASNAEAEPGKTAPRVKRGAPVAAGRVLNPQPHASRRLARRQEMDVAPVPDSGAPRANTPSHFAASVDDAAEEQFSFLFESLCGAAGAAADEKETGTGAGPDGKNPTLAVTAGVRALNVQPLTTPAPEARPAAALSPESRPASGPGMETGGTAAPHPDRPGTVAGLAIPVAALQAPGFAGMASAEHPDADHSDAGPSDDDGSRHLPAACARPEPGPPQWAATENMGAGRNPLEAKTSNPAPGIGSGNIVVAEAVQADARTALPEMAFAMRVAERPVPAADPARAVAGGLPPALLPGFPSAAALSATPSAALSATPSAALPVTGAADIVKTPPPPAREGDAAPGRIEDTAPGSRATGTASPDFKQTPGAASSLNAPVSFDAHGSPDAPGSDRFRAAPDSNAGGAASPAGLAKTDAAGYGLSNQLRNRDQEPGPRGRTAPSQPGPAAVEPSVPAEGAGIHSTPAPHLGPAPGAATGPMKGAGPDRAPAPQPHLAAAEAATVGLAERRAAEPARDISVRLTAADKSPVEVRLMERAGEVRVAVRSADAELSQAARAGLSQLVERMAERGFDAEVWRPAAAGRPAESGHDRHSGDAGASDQRGSGERRHPGNRQGEQQNERGSQPKWVDELETSFGPAKLRTGV